MTHHETAVAFAEAWGEGNWEEAYDLTQKSWADGYDVRALERKLGKVPIKAAEVDDHQRHSAVMYDVILDLKGPGLEERKLRMRLVKETKPGHGHPNGSWGVNPSSISPV